MSLDEEEEKQQTPRYYLRLLLTDDQEITLSSVHVDRFALKSNYFKLLSLQREPPVVIDFSVPSLKVSLQTFAFVQDLLTHTIPPTLTKDLDLESVERLSIYLGLATDRLSFQEYYTYTQYLTVEDRALRDEELKLRHELFSNEDEDYRVLDEQIRFDRVCQRLNFPLTPVAAKPLLVHQKTAAEQGPFWGRFGPLKRCQCGYHVANDAEGNALPGSLCCRKHSHVFKPDPLYAIQRYNQPYQLIGNPQSFQSVSVRSVSYTHL